MSFNFFKKSENEKLLESSQKTDIERANDIERAKTRMAINSTPEEILGRKFVIKYLIDINIHIGSTYTEKREIFVASALYSDFIVKSTSKYNWERIALSWESNGFIRMFVVPLVPGSNFEKTVISIFKMSNDMPIFTQVYDNIPKAPYMYKELLEERKKSISLQEVNDMDN